MTSKQRHLGGYDFVQAQVSQLGWQPPINWSAHRHCGGIDFVQKHLSQHRTCHSFGTKGMLVLNVVTVTWVKVSFLSKCQLRRSRSRSQMEHSRETVLVFDLRPLMQGSSTRSWRSTVDNVG
ncbi:hypothetical protein BHM03_00060972 [Ensete ventricosum]|nr:hypothetical protein BHM03_00060972 [Ensete ventricosum]